MPADPLFPAPTTRQIGRYMTAVPLGRSPRSTWRILSRGGDQIGRVEWYSEWSQFTLAASADAVWSSGCLRDVARFADELTRGAK